MKGQKYLLIVTVLFLCFSKAVKAESCDEEDIQRLKVIANNIEITYEYNDDVKDVNGLKVYDTYTVHFNNMSDEIYIIETKSDKMYYYTEIKDGYLTFGNINSGQKIFKFYSTKCDKALGTKNIDLPKFNYYSTDPNCEGKEDLEICQKFYDTSNLEYSDFYNKIVEYENAGEQNVDDESDDENNQFIETAIQFVKDNYIYIGIGVVAIVLIIVLLVIRHRKRGVLE